MLLALYVTHLAHTHTRARASLCAWIVFILRRYCESERSLLSFSAVGFSWCCCADNATGVSGAIGDGTVSTGAAATTSSFLPSTLLIRLPSTFPRSSSPFSLRSKNPSFCYSMPASGKTKGRKYFLQCGFRRANFPPSHALLFIPT